MRDRDTQATMPTAPTRPKEQIARLGKDICQRDIRQQVENGHIGEVVAINIGTGIWAIDNEVLEAVDRLRISTPGTYEPPCAVSTSYTPCERQELRSDSPANEWPCWLN